MGSTDAPTAPAGTCGDMPTNVRSPQRQISLSTRVLGLEGMQKYNEKLE
jgi:hypothetical protein